MSRWIFRIFIIVILSMPCTVAAQEQEQSFAINFMLPAERMDLSLFREFSQKYDTKINPVYYTSAFLMMVRIRQGVDAAPIDVVATQMHNQQILQEMHGLELLDHTKIPNLHRADMEFLGDCSHDPNNNYTVPLVGGEICLLVNKAQINPSEITSYADLWRPDLKGRVLIPEESGNLLLLALKVMQVNTNNPDQATLNTAWEKMFALAENSSLITNNALSCLLEDNEIALALVYSPDALQAMRHNPNLVLVTPREGRLCWVEAISIPAQARNKEPAHAYINYLLQPEVLASICKNTGFVPLNSKAYALLQQQGNSPLKLLPPKELVNASGNLCHIPLDKQNLARWHTLIEDKQFLY